MNKLFTKVAALTLGVAMAAGVGVALGSAKASPVEAEASYTFTGDTVTFKNQGLENGVPYNDPFTNNQFSVQFGGGANDGKYYTTGEGIRTYANGYFTVTGISGNVTSLTFTWDGTNKPTANVASVGSFNSDFTIWTGDAETVTFTRPSGSGHWRLKAVTAVIAASEVAKINLSKTELKMFNTDEAQVITATPINFASTPTISVSGTPSYVNVAINGLSISVSPKAIGSETVTFNATDGAKNASATLKIEVNSTHGRIESDPMTCAETITLMAGEYDNTVTYYISGKISSGKSSSVSSGQITFNMSDNGQASNEVQAYKVKYLNNENFTSVDQVMLGDYVVVCGTLTLYQGTTIELQYGHVCVHTPKTRELVSIALSGTYPTEFEAGDEFSYEGLVVTANYDDSTDKVVTPTSVSTPDMATVGQKEVTVTYIEDNISKTASYNINVIAPLPRYDVSFDAGQGSGTMETVKVKEGEEYVLPKCTFTAPEGKVFKSWTVDGVAVTKITVIANVTVVATWKTAPVETAATITGGTNGSDCVVNVGGIDNNAVKVGTSSAGGDLKVTVGAGADYVRFYAAAWKDVNGLSLDITGATVNPASVSLTMNNGISGNSPFTFDGSADDYEFVVELSGITQETDLTFTTSIAKRFVMWGAVYGINPVEDWSDEQKTNFAAALDGLVPPFVKTTADPTINTETGFVEYYGEGDVKATYVSYFTQNDWKAEGGGSYSKESPNGHGVITGYAGDATATGTYIMFQYKVYVTVTVVEGADSKEYKIGSGSDFVLPQPTESSIPAGKQFKAWEVDNKEFDPGDILEQVTSAVTVVAVYEDIPAPAPTLESIAVSGKYKTKYGYQAEEFDKEGIVVTATYSDQSQQPVDLTDVEFSGYNKSVLGEQTVTVTYQEKTTTFTVTVYYTATYKPGEGTSEVGEYVEYIENPDNYELVAFEKTGFVAPEGKQFKEWSQGTTGKSVQVNGNLSFTAVYEDIPATDWSADQKAAFGQALEGAVPPFLGAEFAGISYNAQYGAFVIVVSGNLVNQIKAAFNGLTDWVENTQYSQFRKTTAHGVAVVQYQFTEGEQEDPGSTQVIIAWSQTSWLPAQEADFESKLDNFVPPYYYVLSYMSWDDSIGAYKYAYLDPEKEDYNAFKNYFDYYFTAVEGEDGYYYYQTANGKVYVELSSTQVTQGLATFCYMYYAADPIPTSLQLDTTDVKVSYYVGDEFDATGLVVKVLDENGDVMYGGQDVAQYCEFEYDFSAAGAAVVTVKLEVEQDVFLSAEINVTVEEAPVVYDADAFAKELLEKVAPICANYDGKKNNKTALKGVWTEMALKYETLSEEEKAKVVEAAAKTDGTDLEKAMAFYNYACKKYNLTKFIAGRQVKAIVNEQVPTGNSILPIIVIVAASVTAVTAIGVVIALKRRKNFLTK